MCPVLLAVLVDAFHWLVFLRGVGLGPFDELMFCDLGEVPSLCSWRRLYNRSGMDDARTVFG